MLKPIHAVDYLKLLARRPVLEYQEIELEVIAIVRIFPPAELVKVGDGAKRESNNPRRYATEGSVCRLKLGASLWNQ